MCKGYIAPSNILVTLAQVLGSLRSHVYKDGAGNEFLKQISYHARIRLLDDVLMGKCLLDEICFAVFLNSGAAGSDYHVMETNCNDHSSVEELRCGV